MWLHTFIGRFITIMVAGLLGEAVLKVLAGPLNAPTVWILWLGVGFVVIFKSLSEEA